MVIDRVLAIEANKATSAIATASTVGASALAAGKPRWGRSLRSAAWEPAMRGAWAVFSSELHMFAQGMLI